MIYAGDFNASRDHAEFRAILGTGLVDAGDALSVAPWPGFTWPTDQFGPAATRIDHILITPTSIGVRKVTIVSVPGTDHLGVIADLEVST
jgi:endonuclease/exonuclease/phosphatase family metal-dependent hydrolase